MCWIVLFAELLPNITSTLVPSWYFASLPLAPVLRAWKLVQLAPFFIGKFSCMHGCSTWNSRNQCVMCFIPCWWLDHFFWDKDWLKMCRTFVDAFCLKWRCSSWYTNYSFPMFSWKDMYVWSIAFLLMACHMWLLIAWCCLAEVYQQQQ